MKLTNLFGIAACAALVPAAAAAQMCLGTPTRAGQSAVALQSGVVEDARLYGVEAYIDLQSRIALGGRFRVAALEGDDSYSITTVGGTISYGALETPSFQLCPVTGFEFSSWNSNAMLAIPVGIGMGATFGSRFRTTFYGIPQFLWLDRWLEVPVIEDGALGSRSLDETTFGAQTGINFAYGRFFAGGSVFNTMLEGDDARYLIQAGMLFGGN